MGGNSQHTRESRAPAIVARTGVALAGICVAPTKRMPAPLVGLVVAVVEDDPDALALFRFILEREGAVVLPASEPQSVLETLSSLRPHVLVSDMQMPDWAGARLVAEARSRGLLEGVPTLAVTALTMTPEEVQAAGFDAYLHKPVDPHQLCQTVYDLARPSA